MPLGLRLSQESNFEGVAKSAEIQFKPRFTRAFKSPNYSVPRISSQSKAVLLGEIACENTTLSANRYRSRKINCAKRLPLL